MSAVQEMPAPVAPADIVITVGDVIATVRARWSLLALIALFFGVIGGVYAFTAPRFYRAETQLVIERNTQGGGTLAALASQAGGLAQLGGLSLGGNVERGEAMTLLKSRSLSERIITRYKLMDELFPPAKRSADDPPPTMWRAVRKFSQDVISVQDDRLTGVITVSCEWTNSTLAAQWANLLVSEANAVSREHAIADADRALGFLQKELEKTSSVEVRAAIFRLVESQLNQRMLANVRTDYVVRAVDPATVPERPVRPRRLLVLAGSMMFGGFVAAVVALVMAARSAARRDALVPR